jgi:hypothetical protein
VTSKKLPHTLKLNSNGLAYVVNDNLFDSYQRPAPLAYLCRGESP